MGKSGYVLVKGMIKGTKRLLKRRATEQGNPRYDVVTVAAATLPATHPHLVGLEACGGVERRGSGGGVGGC